MCPRLGPIVPQRLRNNRGMRTVRHLIIAYAAPPTVQQPDGGAPPPAPPALPALQQALAHATPQAQHVGDAWSLTPPHEHAYAQALGWTVADGQLPWAAWHAGRVGVGCAWLWPCAWQAGLDHITIVPPQALDVRPHEADALRRALAPYAADDGIVLRGDDPVRWHAEGAPFERWRSASLDRVAHRRADGWWRDAGSDPAARTLLRLLNEAQMLFHDHPVNAERAARGQLPINGLWISGAGRWDGSGVAASQTDVRLVDDLSVPATRGDAAVWAATWQTLDTTVLAPWLAEPAPDAAPRWLTLCGERGWRTWRLEPGAAPPPPERRPWRDLWGRLRGHPPATAPATATWWSGL
ncbi:hypothetical protein Tther_02368 [Tepidimonas thermarum]|uniref:Cofactor-independent phosphoglycerate mutase n=2 Tax=Tepidimonas thermarum TaxID=335431 RepID=A0A554WWZ3_9BURK|nr:hypothetical protein Tther_02368 [Tepidimonas thermarum]